MNFSGCYVANGTAVLPALLCLVSVLLSFLRSGLTRPALGFVDLARGMGVAGTRVETADAIGAAVAAGFASGKPTLIEIAIEGKR